MKPVNLGEICFAQRCAISNTAQRRQRTGFSTENWGASISVRRASSGMKVQGRSGAKRGFSHINDNHDDFLVVFPFSPAAHISQCGRSLTVGPGSCTILTTSRPFDGHCGLGADVAYSEYVVRLPGTILRQNIPSIDDGCARLIDLKESGAGKILLGLINLLIRERECYSSSQAVAYGPVLIGCAINFLLESPELSTENVKSVLSSKSQVYRNALSFIQSHLSNPKLNPEMIASSCRVSLSYLYTAFGESERSVSETIRELRLQRCREALIAPTLRDKSISQIAYKWGFLSGSSFSHSYKSRFGTSPQEDRKSAFYATKENSHARGE